MTAADGGGRPGGDGRSRAEPPLTTALAELRIDGARLIERLENLARHGGIDRDGRPVPAGVAPTGSSRLAATEADGRGRDLVTGWMRELGLAVRIDEVGNVIGVRAAADGSTDRPVMTGSHIDTVATGGKYDGNLGVLSALEVVATLNDHAIATRRPIAVGFFTNEEGVRFQPDMMGSLVYAGGLPAGVARAARDQGGKALGDELAAIGYLGEAPAPGPVPFAFVEMHIEQGPVLERDGATIGAVTGVQGISWTEVRIAGQGNHAGTTPMGSRRDAGLAAARLSVFLDDLARGGDGQVATVGQVELFPNLINVIPGRARLTVDLRNIDNAALAAAEDAFRGLVEELAERYGLEIGLANLVRFDPVDFDARMVGLVERTARRLGHPVQRIASGAGHDAQMLARIAPTAMIFATSHGGISHDPAEWTRPEDLVAAADTLLHTILELTEGDHLTA
ncbi:MAG: Zn-dependent hydrolase [Chloroflexota bacterium]